MSVPNFMSKAFSYQDSGRGHYVPPSRGMIRRKKTLGQIGLRYRMKKFAKCTRKHLCQGLVFHKVLGWTAVILQKTGL